MKSQPQASQSILITGTSTGIGEACALYLDQMGFRVFAGVRQPEHGARLKAQTSERFTPVLLDVTDAASITSAAETVAATVGEVGLTGLVNNAGISIAGPLECLPIDLLRQQFDVNVVGPIAVIQAFLPLLRQGQGRVINIGSMSSVWAAPFLGPYSSSKFALKALTDAMRLELLPWKIPVTIIEPGSIVTPIWQKGREHMTRLLQEMSTENQARYGATLRFMINMTYKPEGQGLPPQAVADVVYQALTVTSPRRRYLVGADVKLLALWVYLCPIWLHEKIFAKTTSFLRNRVMSKLASAAQGHK
jgi:NAD(P)-dependent dehydrogenase (short-subunit alcohol dehydrogenase family)